MQLYSLHSTPFSNSLKNITWSGKPRCKINIVTPNAPITRPYVEEAFVEGIIERRLLEKCKSKVFLAQYDRDGDLTARNTGQMRCFCLPLAQ